MLTELDLTIEELAQIYQDHRWYPATQVPDVETELRKVFRELLGVIQEYPESEDGVAGAMRIHIEKDPEGNFGQIYLQIGLVEW